MTCKISINHKLKNVCSAVTHQPDSQFRGISVFWGVMGVGNRSKLCKIELWENACWKGEGVLEGGGCVVWRGGANKLVLLGILL